MGPILQSSAYFLQSHCRAVAVTLQIYKQLCSNVIDFTRLLLPIPAPLPANIRCVCAIPGDKDYWHGYLYS